MVNTKPASAKVSPQTFSCPKCGASVTIRALGQTLTVVCGSCTSTIDASNDKFQLIEQYHQKMKYKTRLSIGQKGVIQGSVWQVLGFVQKSDVSGFYEWSEYILFNPYLGYQFLVESSGHWSLVKMVRKHIETKKFDQYIPFQGNTFALFDEGSATVRFILGEFYWRIRVGDTVETRDYISPPLMLSCESDKQEEVWSLGEYLSKEDVARAFKIDSLPAPNGIAPHQPSPWRGPFKKIKIATLIFFGLIVAFQFYHSLTASNVTVKTFTGNFSRNTGPGESLLRMIEEIELKQGEKNLEIKLSTDVNNNWFEVTGQMINETENEDVREFDLGVEYYSGYDSDGSWSEGRRSSRIFLPAIPAGKYKLNLAYSGLSDLAGSETISASIEIKKDVILWQNFFIALGLLGTGFGLMALLVHRFESRRWSNSGIYGGNTSSEDWDD